MSIVNLVLKTFIYRPLKSLLIYMWVWVIRGHTFTPWTMIRGVSSSEIDENASLSQRLSLNSFIVTASVIGALCIPIAALDVALILLALRALWNVVTLSLRIVGC